MLIEEAGGQLGALRTRVDEWSVNPMHGPQSWLIDLVDYQPVDTPEDGRMMLARWRAMGRAHRRGRRRASGAGWPAVRSPRSSPSSACIDELRGLLATPAADWRLARPAAEAHDDWPARRARRRSGPGCGRPWPTS